MQKQGPEGGRVVMRYLPDQTLIHCGSGWGYRHR